jgi:hypothetical protein
MGEWSRGTHTVHGNFVTGGSFAAELCEAAYCFYIKEF